MVRILFLIFLCVMTCACNSHLNEDLCVKETLGNQQEQLLEELRHFNDSLKDSRQLADRTRSGWISPQAIQVATADAVSFVGTTMTLVKAGRWFLNVTGGAGLHIVAGAVLAGATINSSTASYIAYKYLNESAPKLHRRAYMQEVATNESIRPYCVEFSYNINNMAYVEEDSVIITNDSIYSYMGMLHNKILSRLLNEPILPLPINPEIPDTTDLNIYGINVFTQEQLDSIACEHIVLDSVYVANADYEGLITAYYERGDISNISATILQLFVEAIDADYATLQEINATIMHYKYAAQNNIVLSPKDRQDVLMVLEGWQRSFNFWRTRLN